MHLRIFFRFSHLHRPGKHVTCWLPIMNQSHQTDLVFQALASRPRRMIMDLVRHMPGCSVNEVCEHFEMSRIGVMKHLQILVDARLVLSRKPGRTRELFFNAAPIQMIYDRWTDEYSAFWATQAVDLKYQVEASKKIAKRRATTGSAARRKSVRPRTPRKRQKQVSP